MTQSTCHLQELQMGSETRWLVFGEIPQILIVYFPQAICWATWWVLNRLNVWQRMSLVGDDPYNCCSPLPHFYTSATHWNCSYFMITQVRIQDLVKGGAPASAAESCRRSEAESCERSEQYAAGVQGPLKGPGSFWVFNAQICILTHSRDSFSLIFDIYFDTKSW